MEHGKKKMKMQEGGKTTRKKRGMQNKERLRKEAEERAKRFKGRRTRGQIAGKKGPSFPKAAPKKTGPKMSDIMGGARGPMGPLGGPKASGMSREEFRKLILKRATGSTFDPTKANRAGQRMGQRKAGGKIKKMAMGGKMKPVDKAKNPGLAKLPTEVRNKMGFMKKGGLMAAIKKVDAEKMYGGGMTKKKMKGGGMAMKYKHGGKTGKCPRDGIAMRGKTKAGR
tara:strand:- start:340 stop:1014 length:675 start_codon:yes stop_codon:yes gene_type:complete